MIFKAVFVLGMMVVTGKCYWIPLNDPVKCSAPMDLVLMLQSSENNGVKWEQVKSFAKSFVEKFQNDISESGTHVGVITFCTEAEVRVKLSQGVVNAKTIEHDLGQVKPMKGASDVEKALRLANTNMFSEAAGMRDSAKKVCVVVTNGILEGERILTDSAAKPLKEKGVQVFSVGVGEDMSVMNLIAMANHPDYVFGVDFIDDVVNKIRETNC